MNDPSPGRHDHFHGLLSAPGVSWANVRRSQGCVENGVLGVLAFPMFPNMSKLGILPILHAHLLYDIVFRYLLSICHPRGFGPKISRGIRV
jgi:hypothetical protein